MYQRVRYTLTTMTTNFILKKNLHSKRGQGDASSAFPIAFTNFPNAFTFTPILLQLFFFLLQLFSILEEALGLSCYKNQATCSPCIKYWIFRMARLLVFQLILIFASDFHKNCICENYCSSCWPYCCCHAACINPGTESAPC